MMIKAVMNMLHNIKLNLQLIKPNFLFFYKIMKGEKEKKFNIIKS